MHLRKLARFLSWELPSSKAIPIADFVKLLENNLNIDDEKLNEWKHKELALAYDYKQLLEYLYSTKDWEWKICRLLEVFELPKNFLCELDFSKYKCWCWDLKVDLDELSLVKENLLKDYEKRILEIDKKDPKNKGDDFEELCENEVE